MIGQTDLLDKLHKLIDADEFPQFSIFIGAKGSGKNTLMQEIAPLISSNVVTLPDVKIDTIREMIESANKKASAGAKIVYIIRDSEQMSLPAKNSILKIVEEPPKGAYFMMSVVNEADLLDTIKNRAAIFRMRPYSLTDKQDYLGSCKTRLDDDTESFVLKTANTLYDIEMLLKSNPRELERCANDLIDSFAKDSTARLLNYIKKIAFKPDADGYEPLLFFKVCLVELGHRAYNSNQQRGLMYSMLMKRTMDAMSDFRYSSVSKEKIFDMWILDCRKIVKKYGDKSSKEANTR